MDRRGQLGARGERMAESHLVARGYRVLDRNFRTRHGELDLVAAGGRFLVFCEVKTRIGRSHGALGPLASIGRDKRRRLRLMARQWLGERAGADRPYPAEMRFDAVGVTLSEEGRLLELEHVEDAF
jgi:putative endonuclease